jgi:hypothetical protein
MMYLVLGKIYPSLMNLLIFFCLLDYGSHFLQFTANALVKNISHKEMSDPNENWLVRMYYSNFAFFAMHAAGADTGLVLAFLYGRSEKLKANYVFTFFTIVTSIIICSKMIINVS